jgi:hypothetical protein
VCGDESCDAVVLDDHCTVREQCTGGDVEHPPRANRMATRHGGRLPVSGTRVVPQTASGAPSQQLAFMWQWGHSHRVAMGSNSTPQ